MTIDGPHGFAVAAFQFVCARYSIEVIEAEADWRFASAAPRFVGSEKYALSSVCIPRERQVGTGRFAVGVPMRNLREIWTACPPEAWSTPDVATLLHEAAHVILGPRSLKIREQEVLLSFEWQLVRWLSKRAPTKQEGEALLSETLVYMSSTEIERDGEMDPFFEVSDMRRAWFRQGTQRAVQLGLLTDRPYRPTFQRACWSGVRHQAWARVPAP